ncbi:plasmalemma vesicle-associated protein-like [Discoglossus pictus]
MDKSYAMAKFGLESKEILRSHNKGCWHYCKYFFIFTAIIQFLIILGLVLFMVYGNAHVATENRLKNVEELNQKLLGDIQQLKGNLGFVSRLQNSTALERNKCNASLQAKQGEVDRMNKTILFQNIRFQQLTIQNTNLDSALKNCKNCPEISKLANFSCQVEKIAMQQEKFHLQIDYNNYRENCTKNTINLNTKVEEAVSEREKYRIQMIDLRNNMNDAKTELQTFKSSCTSIEQRFKTELDRFRDTVDSTIKKYMSSTEYYTHQNCKDLINEMERKTELFLAKLNQDIISTKDENSKLRVSKERTEVEKKQCLENKGTLLQQKNSELITMQRNWDVEIRKAYDEKNELRKQIDESKKGLKECTDSLKIKDSQLAGKIEELQRCKPMFPSVLNFRGPGTGNV